MRKYYVHCIAALLASLTLTACVSTGGGSNNLNTRLDRQEQQIQTLLNQVGQVEQVLPGQAETWSQMQTMRQEVNMLTGRIDELHMQATGQGAGELATLRDRVNNLESVVRKMASQLAINVDALNTPAPVNSYPDNTMNTYLPPVQSAAQTQPAQNNPVLGTPTTDTATALYDSGIKAFDQRRYKDAVIAFKDFTAAFPQHQLASNSYFWEGESHFQLKDYARAVVAYQEVIANFPGSPKLQSSMLKQGISLYNLKKGSAGRERLDDLVKRYPSSPEATRAKQFMAQNK